MGALARVCYANGLPTMRTPLLLVTVLGCIGSGLAFGYDSLGPESCQGCHPEAYATWKRSPHARAKESLQGKSQTDARCLSCHSPIETEQRVAAVTCETCHGGGQYYATRYVMKDSELARLVGLVDPTEKQCRSCHDSSSPSLRPFDFAAALKALDHWSEEKVRREKDKASP